MDRPVIPGLKTYANIGDDNKTFSFFLIYDKLSGLYCSGKIWLDTMNNAQVYRTPKSALEALKILRKGAITYAHSKPGEGGRQVKCDPVAVLHSVSVKTLPTYTYAELQKLAKETEKEVRSIEAKMMEDEDGDQA